MKKFTKQYYLDFLLSVIFILTLGISSISNNTHLNLTLKLVSVIFFSVMTVLRLKFIYDIKVNNVSQIIVTDLTNPFLKKFIVVSAIIFLILSATLSYSHYTDYGIWKIVNLVLVMFPFLFLVLINIKHEPMKLYEIFVKVTEIFLVTGGLFVFLLAPFDYLGIEYKLSLERWSHVVFGRVSGFLFLIYLLHLLLLKEKVTIYNLLIIAVSIYSIYLTGLRAAIVGLMIIIPLIFIVSFYFKREFIRIAKLAAVLVVVVVLGLLFNNTNESSERLGKISSIVTTGETDDGAVNARLDGWMVGWEMIKDSPFLGRGIGGYNSEFRDYEVQKLIEYPHNLFVELVVEFGLLGWIFSIMLILFIVYFGKIILLSDICGEREKRRRGEEENGRMGGREKGRNNISLSFTSDFSILISVFFLFLFSLWLGMFSKDISSQSLLWVSLSVLSLQYSIWNKAEKYKDKSGTQRNTKYTQSFTMLKPR